MYISELSIKNFRSFNNETTIYFNDGINVIIGQNNAGKTTVIKALELLFDNKSNNKLTINDFNRNTSIEELKKNPPKIIISAKLLESKDESAFSDELVTVATWLTSMNTPYEAKITYEFFLPEREIEEYTTIIEEIIGTDINEYWKAIEDMFLKKFISKIYVGNPEYKNQVSPDDINRFAFQFLTAIRDVERDLYKGNNSLLKEVIDFFIDYDIKSDSKLEKKEKIRLIQEKKMSFSLESKKIIESLQERMKTGEAQILKYVQSTGAGIDDSKPTFDGAILDTELYSALRLIVEKESGIKLPAINNGLGYNNLIYISLLLSKMQRDASGEYLGSNSKVFSILAIEEPEAHLHPNMQYKFLQFLKENRNSEVNQIFITSHSPNITAAVDLEDLIVVQKIKNEVRIAYPGKVFKKDDADDIKSKNYVKRFIDVTKADLFFAQNIILVEGIAEQLVIPEFAKAMECNLADTHTSVINVGGRYFNHFLKLFDVENSKFAIFKKVACITDLDPVRKEINQNENHEEIDESIEVAVEESREDKSWKACSPLFLDIQSDKYKYKYSSNSTVNDFVNKQDSLIKVYSQTLKESSTFEYDLIMKNPLSERLLTSSVSNLKEIKDLMEYLKEDKPLNFFISRLGKSNFKTEVEEVFQLGLLEDNTITKKKLIASRYLMSIKKGEVAQELAQVINLKSDVTIIPPDYMNEAIRWICQ